MAEEEAATRPGFAGCARCEARDRAGCSATNYRSAAAPRLSRHRPDRWRRRHRLRNPRPARGFPGRMGRSAGRRCATASNGAVTRRCSATPSAALLEAISPSAGRGALVGTPRGRRFSIREIEDLTEPRACRRSLFEPVCCNPFRSILMRGIVYACDGAPRLIAGYESAPRTFTPPRPRAAVGYACTEAPRGIVYHRYRLAMRPITATPSASRKPSSSRAAWAGCPGVSSLTSSKASNSEQACRCLRRSPEPSKR
jgi:hypothetical protein